MIPSDGQEPSYSAEGMYLGRLPVILVVLSDMILAGEQNLPNAHPRCTYPSGVPFGSTVKRGQIPHSK